MRAIAKAIVPLVLVFTGVAEAQNTSVLVTATIPFDFSVGNTPLPAGEYTAYSLRPGVVLMRAMDNPSAAAVALCFHASPNNGHESDTNRLVFNKYSAGRIFLSQVWHAGSAQGAWLSKSRREREAVTSHLITGNRPETVTIFAKAR